MASTRFLSIRFYEDHFLFHSDAFAAEGQNSIYSLKGICFRINNACPYVSLHLFLIILII